MNTSSKLFSMINILIYIPIVIVQGFCFLHIWPGNIISCPISMYNYCENIFLKTLLCISGLIYFVTPLLWSRVNIICSLIKYLKSLTYWYIFPKYYFTNTLFPPAKKCNIPLYNVPLIYLYAVCISLPYI